MSVGDYIHKSVVKYSVMGLMLTNDATVFVVVVFEIDSVVSVFMC